MNNLKIATIISYVTLLLGNLISLLYTPFMLMSLGQSEYGLFSLTNTIISYVYLLDMGFGNAVIRYNSKYMAENDEESCKNLNGMFLVLYLVVAVIAGIIGIIMYQNFDRWFAQGLSLEEISRIKVMFIIAIINLVCAFPLNIFNGIILAHEKFVFTKMITLLRTIINPLVMIMILLLGYKAIGMLIGSTVFNLAIGAMNIIFCFKYLNVKFKFNHFDKYLLKEIFNFSFFIFLSAIAYKIYWSTDQIILGMFVSASSISIYSIGSQLNGYFTSFSNVINSMFLPKLTKLTVSTTNKKELMNIIVKVSRIQYFIASFILVGFILVGKAFIIRWAGPEYNQSYFIALLVMGPQLFSIIQALFATLLEAMNKHKIKSFIYLSVAVFNLILTLILVKPYGMIGCAIATAIGMTINAILNNIYYKFTLKLDMEYYWKEILKLCPTSIVIFILGIFYVKLIHPTDYFGIFIFGIIFSITYFGCLWLFGFNKSEKNTIKSFFLKIIHLLK
ncbi:polysaccharide biosynthesis C-terminal domain-containing protein [Turicibacter sanguinis]|uniref:oligosaccharide flippase family protein n=1 Tax=Turicibacter sanguinis TaxID=154288 RepID=UPI0018AC467B|nr:polysaccharide biosynthesis C-terminal domain-containing protein [Turicibacter sanguinis]MDB8551641.1 oligosaccharide flippase family protein [Turicibacter sanguinis]